VLLCHEGCELHDCHDHGERRALDGDKGLVDVDAHYVCIVVEWFAVFLSKDVTDDFDEEFLRVARAEIEADRFEDETFETDDNLALFKNLSRSQ
jgi:hypothetical protein